MDFRGRRGGFRHDHSQGGGCRKVIEEGLGDELFRVAIV